MARAVDGLSVMGEVLESSVATALLIMATAGAVVIGVRSIPDIRRYLKIRNM